MLTPNHPDDERLSALAAGDDDATADAALVTHLDGCARCADLVAELAVLRASLAELPDVAPSRPLRLLPPVEERAPNGADRLAGWVRRLFAPALTAGATLALVGVVGTAAPAMQSGADGALFDAMTGGGGAQQGAAGDEAPDEEGGRILSATDSPAAPADGAGGEAELDVQRQEADSAEADVEGLPAERSPWPMVLFTGVALVVGALLLRWILVPRAG